MAWFVARPCPVLGIRTRIELVRFLAASRDKGSLDVVILDVKAMGEEEEKWPPSGYSIYTASRVGVNKGSL